MYDLPVVVRIVTSGRLLVEFKGYLGVRITAPGKLLQALTKTQTSGDKLWISKFNHFLHNFELLLLHIFISHHGILILRSACTLSICGPVHSKLDSGSHDCIIGVYGATVAIDSVVVIVRDRRWHCTVFLIFIRWVMSWHEVRQCLADSLSVFIHSRV